MTTAQDVMIDAEVRKRQYKIDRLDNMERWTKLGGILATLVLVVVLLIAVAWQSGKINNIKAANEKLTCVALLQSEFMGEVGDFANSPPAPNSARDKISGDIKTTAKRLHAVAGGKKCDFKGLKRVDVH